MLETTCKKPCLAREMVPGWRNHPDVNDAHQEMPSTRPLRKALADNDPNTMIIPVIGSDNEQSHWGGMLPNA